MSKPSGRKTVLFIGPVPPPITGQALACHVFIEALRDEHNVILIDINKSDFASGRLGWQRVREIFQILLRVRCEVRHADAIYFTITESLLGNVKDLLIYLVCWRLLPRTVIHLHGGAGMMRLLNSGTGFLRRLNALFLKRMAAVIVLGDRLRVIYQGIIAPEKLHVVMNFAESEYQVSAEAVKAKFSARGPLRILYLSNMIKEKGYHLLRDAVEAIAVERPGSIQLDYAGGFVSDAERNAFLALIASDPRITYHGVVRGDVKQRLLEQAHILALPTWYPFEGQPISILEGYAAGCAVLTTDHSGIFDVFTPDENGWAVEKHSSDSIRNALKACLDDPEAVAAAGRHNARLAREHFTTSRYRNELLSIINDTLGVS